ncbi:MAG: hypothetical protein WCP36_04410 [Methanomicrobiales archaeon]
MVPDWFPGRSNRCFYGELRTIYNRYPMIANPGQIIIFGLPVYFYLGIVTFIALISTAVLGMLFIKGKYGVQFSWHLNLARITIVIAIIHGALVAWGYLF